MLPVLTLSIVNVAVWSRYQRSVMIDVLGSGHVRAARARGLPERRVVVAHGMRNALAPLVTLVALALGMAAGVGPVEAALLTEVLRLLGTAITAGLLALTMGLVASVGRGYLPAIGAMSVIIAAAQVAVLFGTGGWFPFAVPGLLAIAGSEGAPQLTAAQVALIPAVTGAGAWAALVWWRRADGV